MGCSLHKQSKNRGTCRQYNFVSVLGEKIKALEEEMNEIVRKREKESEVHEEEKKVFGVKESEWKNERKKLRDEVKRLKKKLEEKEEIVVSEESNNEKQQWEIRGFNYNLLMIKQMREEQLCREEAVEKWKQLYLAIKTELDDLIQRTYRGERDFWRVEDGKMEELQREIKAKEETIEILKARLVNMEEERKKNTTEIDILKQSRKIMSHAKKNKKIGKSRLSSLSLVKGNPIAAKIRCYDT